MDIKTNAHCKIPQWSSSQLSLNVHQSIKKSMQHENYVQISPYLRQSTLKATSWLRNFYFTLPKRLHRLCHYSDQKCSKQRWPFSVSFSPPSSLWSQLHPPPQTTQLTPPPQTRSYMQIVRRPDSLLAPHTRPTSSSFYLPSSTPPSSTATTTSLFPSVVE